MIKKLNLKNIVVLAFLLRITIAPMAEHGDVINYYWWARDLFQKGFLGFYERPIANAMPPTYPPVTTYVFWLSSWLHEIIWKVSWFLNVNLSIFPSNFIFWLENEKGWYFVNKLPAIFADLGIIWLLYKFVKDIKNKKGGILASLLFAFSPPFWYSSSLWGQTDAIYAFFLLGAFYTLFKKRMVLSVLLYLVSVLTKPTGVFALPAFALWWVKNAKWSDYYYSVVLSFTSIVLFYLPFHPTGLTAWIPQFYFNSLGGELNYIVANAFNFWALVHGFQNVPEGVSFFGLPSYVLGYLAFAAFVIAFGAFLILKRIDKVKGILLASVLVSFSAFLILPRIHERYFYPTLLLLIPVAATNKKLNKVFWTLSFMHLINLYHFWWVPRIPILIEFFSNNLVEKTLILVNIGLFVVLFAIFKKDYAKI